MGHSLAVVVASRMMMTLRLHEMKKSEREDDEMRAYQPYGHGYTTVGSGSILRKRHLIRQTVLADKYLP